MIRVFKFKDGEREFCLNTTSDFDAERCISLGYEEIPQEELEGLFGDKITWVSPETTEVIDGKIVFNPPEDIDIIPEKFAHENFETMRQQKLAEYDRKVAQLQRKIRQAQTPEEKARLQNILSLWDKYADRLCDLPEEEHFPWDGDYDKIPWPKMPVRDTAIK